ncbi:FAD-binding oxidoreductase, partial [Candidatus Aerophobetes bacterium]|nr:FAD-binding oxidoreductase [Candidatus Aerophobetes bacterium]
MNYQKITPFIAGQIEKIIDRKDILTDIQDIELYSHDETPGLKSMPEMVVRVRERGQIIELLKLCSREKIPITPRGGGTGLTGGAVPVKGGIVLSFEKMNKIKEIDRENHMAVVEPGVINANLQRELAKEGLFYPV